MIDRSHALNESDVRVLLVIAERYVPDTEGFHKLLTPAIAKLHRRQNLLRNKRVRRVSQSMREFP